MRAALLAMVLALAGCGAEPEGSLVYEPPFGIISIAINTSGEISVSAASPELVTPIGKFHVEGGVSKGLADDESKAGTVLVVRQTIETAQQDSVYRIESDHKKRILLDGRFVQDIERNKVTITVVPGTESKITITDITGTKPPPMPEPAPTAQVKTGPWKVSGSGVQVVVDSVTRSGDLMTIIARVTSQNDLSFFEATVLDTEGNVYDGVPFKGRWEIHPQAGIMVRNTIVVRIDPASPPKGLTMTFKAFRWDQNQRLKLQIPL